MDNNEDIEVEGNVAAQRNIESQILGSLSIEEALAFFSPDYFIVSVSIKEQLIVIISKITFVKVVFHFQESAINVLYKLYWTMIAGI